MYYCVVLDEGAGRGERVIVTGGQLLTRSDAEDKSYLL